MLAEKRCSAGIEFYLHRVKLYGTWIYKFLLLPDYILWLRSLSTAVAGWMMLGGLSLTPGPPPPGLHHSSEERGGRMGDLISR